MLLAVRRNNRYMGAWFSYIQHSWWMMVFVHLEISFISCMNKSGLLSAQPPPLLPDITWYIYTLVYIINTNKSVPRYFGGQSWNFPSLSAYSRTGNSFFRDQSLAWIVFLLCFFDSVIIFIQKQKVCFAHAASCAADDNSRHTERDNPMVATKSPRPYA